MSIYFAHLDVCVFIEIILIRVWKTSIIGNFIFPLVSGGHVWFYMAEEWKNVFPFQSQRWSFVSGSDTINMKHSKLFACVCLLHFFFILLRLNSFALCHSFRYYVCGRSHSTLSFLFCFYLRHHAKRKSKKEEEKNPKRNEKSVYVNGRCENNENMDCDCPSGNERNVRNDKRRQAASWKSFPSTLINERRNPQNALPAPNSQLSSLRICRTIHGFVCTTTAKPRAERHEMSHWNIHMLVWLAAILWLSPIRKFNRVVSFVASHFLPQILLPHTRHSWANSLDSVFW